MGFSERAMVGFVLEGGLGAQAGLNPLKPRFTPFGRAAIALLGRILTRFGSWFHPARSGVMIGGRSAVSRHETSSPEIKGTGEVIGHFSRSQAWPRFRRLAASGLDRIPCKGLRLSPISVSPSAASGVVPCSSGLRMGSRPTGTNWF